MLASACLGLAACGETEPSLDLVPNVAERGADVALTIDDISPGPLRAGPVLLERKRRDGSWEAEYAVGLKNPDKGGRMEPLRDGAPSAMAIPEVSSSTIEITIPRSANPRGTWRLTRAFSVDPEVPPAEQSIRLTIVP